MGAKMSPALSHRDALDRSFTPGTGLAGSPVHPKMVLKISAAIDPVDASTIAADALPQHLPDPLP